jgi:hypothetical protein
MKKLIALGAVSALALFLGGCASTVSNQQNYDAYLSQSGTDYATYINALEQAPLLDLKLPAPEGKEYHLIVNHEPAAPKVQQIKDDEQLRFWGKVIQGGLPVLGNLGSTWINAHYNSENEKAMWKFFEQGGGGGYQFSTDGGDLTLSDSDFVTARIDGTGNGFQSWKRNQFSEGASGTANPYGSTQDNDTQSTTQSQSGGEDSNLVQ